MSKLRVNKDSMSLIITGTKPTLLNIGLFPIHLTGSDVTYR